MDRFCVVVSTVTETESPSRAVATGGYEDLIWAPKPNGARLFVAIPGCSNGEVEWKEVKGGATAKVADAVLDYRANAAPDLCSLADLVHSLCDRLPQCGYYVDLYWIFQEVADRSLPLALVAALMRLTEWHRGRIVVLPARGGQQAAPQPLLPVELGGQFGIATVRSGDLGDVATQDTYWRGNLVMDSAVVPGCSLRCLNDGTDQGGLPCLSCFVDEGSTAPRMSVPANNLLLITDVPLDCISADLPCHQRYAFELPPHADTVLHQSRLLFDKLAERKRALLLKLDWLQPEIGHQCHGGLPGAAAAPDDACSSRRCCKLTTQDWVSHVVQGRWQQHQPAHAAMETCSKRLASAFFLLTTEYVDGAKTLIATCVHHPDIIRSCGPGVCHCHLSSSFSRTLPVDAEHLQHGPVSVSCGPCEQHACKPEVQGMVLDGDAPTAGQHTAATRFFDLFFLHNPAHCLDVVHCHLGTSDSSAALACSDRPRDALTPSRATLQEVECDISDWPERRALKSRRLGSSCRGNVKECQSPSPSVDDARHQSQGLCLTIHEMARRLSAALIKSDLLPAAVAGSCVLPPPEAVLPWPTCKIAYVHGVHYNLDNSTEKEEARLLRYCSGLVRHEISSTCSSSSAQGFPILVSQAASGIVTLRPSQEVSARQPKQSPASKRRASSQEARTKRIRPQRLQACTDEKVIAHRRQLCGGSPMASSAVACVTAPKPAAATSTSVPCLVQSDETDSAIGLSAPPRSHGNSLAGMLGRVPHAVRGAGALGPSHPDLAQDVGQQYLASVVAGSNRSSGRRKANFAVPLSADEHTTTLPDSMDAAKQARTDPAQQAAGKQKSKESRSERHKRRLLDIVTKVLGQKGLTPESSAAFSACQQRLFSTVKGFVKDLPNSHSLGENMHRLAMRFCDEVIEFETGMLKSKNSLSKTRTLPLS